MYGNRRAFGIKVVFRFLAFSSIPPPQSSIFYLFRSFSTHLTFLSFSLMSFHFQIRSTGAAGCLRKMKMGEMGNGNRGTVSGD